MKKERGITLIALVITVIIMLILAGVALGQITGEEGLLSRAGISVNKYENSAQKEEDRITEILNKADNKIPTKAEIEVNEDSITTKKATLIGKGEASGSEIAKYEFYVDGVLYKTVETEETNTSIDLTFTKDSHVCYVRVYNKEDNYLDSAEITVNKHVHTDECYGLMACGATINKGGVSNSRPYCDNCKASATWNCNAGHSVCSSCHTVDTNGGYYFRCIVKVKKVICGHD